MQVNEEIHDKFLKKTNNCLHMLAADDETFLFQMAFDSPFVINRLNLTNKIGTVILFHMCLFSLIFINLAEINM